jgi:pimeloyl-ACP methyl ester carboxylesterase
VATVRVNGAELYYEDEGTGDCVVFIHGVWVTSRFFRLQMPYFAQSHRAVALDLRGHGRSEHVHHGHTIPQYARDLQEFLQTLGLERPVLVGWSMGSLVIWEYVRQFGASGLRGVVIVDQSPSDYRWPDWPHGPIDFEMLRHIMAEVQGDGREELVRGLLPMIFKELPAEDDQAWMVEEIVRMPATIASSIIFDQTMQDYRDALPLVTVPALVCAGPDGFVTPEAADLMVTAMPDARLVLFEKSRHTPFLEEPERFNEVLHEWIGGLR